jgi:hypothetical protein
MSNPLNRRIICYECIYWDWDRQKIPYWEIGAEDWASICTNPEKWRANDDESQHISEAQDTCRCFEPVSGWDEIWRKLYYEHFKAKTEMEGKQTKLER